MERNAAAGGRRAESIEGAGRRAEFIRVTGVVQGVGFRPFVYALAKRLGVLGWVRNTSAGVEIHAEGTQEVLEALARGVREEAPPRAFVATLTRAAAPYEAHDGFVITESAPDPDAYQLVSPDIATCDDCRRELLDPADRRYRYPVHQLHQLRAALHHHRRAALRPRAHHDAPTSRCVPRATASTPTRPTGASTPQPNACPVCGPRVRLLRVGDGAGEPIELSHAGRAGDPSLPPADGRRAPPRGRDPRGEGPGRLPPGLRRDRRRCGAPPAASASGAPTSRSPSCSATSMSCASIVWPGDDEADLLASPEHPIVLLPWREIAEDGAVGPELGDAGERRRRRSRGGGRAALSGRHAPVHAAARPADAARPGGRSS